MTEAEALDMAARAAGWLDGWGGKDAGPFARLFGSDSIRAHAKTLVAMAELMASGKMAAAAMREAIAELRTRADRIAALKAENERLREAMAAMHKDLLLRAGIDIRDGTKIVHASNGVWLKFCAALERIDHD